MGEKKTNEIRVVSSSLVVKSQVASRSILDFCSFMFPYRQSVSRASPGPTWMTSRMSNLDRRARFSLTLLFLGTMGMGNNQVCCRSVHRSIKTLPSDHCHGSKHSSSTLPHTRESSRSEPQQFFGVIVVTTITCSASFRLRRGCSPQENFIPLGWRSIIIWVHETDFSN